MEALIDLVIKQAKRWAETGERITVLDHLSTLQPDFATKLIRALNRVRAPLLLNGLRDLDAETAAILATYRGELVLDGLTTISAPAAEALAKHRGGISLRGMNVIPSEVAAVLRSNPEIALAPPSLLTFSNSIGMQLIELTSGEFQMGAGYSDPSSPLGYRVRISHPFLIASTEVTNAQWKQVMGDVPSDFKDDDLPVDNVSWHDAKEFCRRLSDFPDEMSARRVYRLPTEAEWEYACRAGTSTRHSFGDDDAMIGEYAWLFATSSGRSHSVAKKKPNQWGIYDMRGNVWEWVSDWSDAPTWTDESIAIDPKGPVRSAEGKRVVRGGCWNDNPDSFRSETLPETRSQCIGFRVVAEVGQRYP